ncbi:lactosylceramide 4-alpha-galactosyltransferase-like [Lepeophtheirus salmonis]|uniref:lactosylceramide 4-alpha-galactosyltransferase-like n=1 Tax=Lepeophtheirus salmonis TaxID=72036 RepID=UPI001AE6B315|nr:lactosylceramide 4-alpha-galactosyltransferase-like [Lepeophtheirus salmonis]
MLQLIKTSFTVVIISILLIVNWYIFFSTKFNKYDNLKSISNLLNKELSFPNDSQIPLFVKTIKNHTMFYEVNIPKDTSFFFLETSGRAYLTLKELCALESVAKLHPKRNIFCLMTNKAYERSAPVLEIMEKYSNIQLLSIDLTYVFKGTVIESLWLKNKIQNSVYFNAHMSDILRYWFVYNYGGTYLDTDIIVLKELPLHYNYAGVENMEPLLVANGVLHFTHHHKLLKMIVADISQNYDGSAWAKNGPLMVTSNLIKLCKGKTMKTINDAKCHNIQLLPPNTFFSIYYPSWQLYFDTGSREIVKKRLNNSLIAHYWGKLSSKTKIKSGMPIHDLALEKCSLTAKYFK